MSNQDICLISDSLSGLIGAAIIQEALQGAKVTLFEDEVTSPTDKRQAQILNYQVSDSSFEDIESAQDSFRWFKKIHQRNIPDLTGVSLTPAFIFSGQDDLPEEFMAMKKIYQVVRKCTERELNLVQPEGTYKDGIYFHTLQVDVEKLENFLRKDFESRGGKLMQSRDICWKSWQNQTILNLKTGSQNSGPRTVITVKAPWMKTAFIFKNKFEIVPGQDAVTISGVQRTKQELWKDVLTAIPNLSQAQILDASDSTFKCGHSETLDLDSDGWQLIINTPDKVLKALNSLDVDDFRAASIKSKL